MKSQLKYLSQIAFYISLICLCISSSLMAENVTGVKKIGKVKYPFISLSVDSTFNRNDFFIGGTAGLFLSREHFLSLNLFFYGRPYKKTVFHERDENRYYQFKQYRYVLGLGMEKLFFISDMFGIFIFGGAAYAFDDYAGTEYSSENTFIPTGGGGLLFNINYSVVFKLGYQYINVPESSGHRSIISITALL